MNLVETCPCGARVELDDPSSSHVSENTRKMLTEWRAEHQHRAIDAVVPKAIPF